MKMWEKKLIKKIEEKLSGDNTGHDLYHALRTRSIALFIAGKEKSDKEILSAAALIHDIGRMDEPERLHIDVALEFAKKELPKIGFPEFKVKQVIEAVKLHEDKPWIKGKKQKPSFKETFILQDADRLDIIGAIGIARSFVFAGAHKIPIYNPKQGLKRYYQKGEQMPDEIRHIEKHLLPMRFHTKAAIKIADKRKRLLKNFISTFHKEWKEFEG
ncbi:MAG: HD domain-containing protein [Candidatus Diapherotrites archaeon]|nr:HD domain-containing protein [Candidatus Diapherotrites archaeon]